MPKPKAAIYCRVSTDKQFDKGGSLETQEERCRAYCERNEYDVIGFYKDVESGGTLKREEFQRLFADAESGKFEVLVVTKIDRLSRSMKDYYSKIINFEKFDVRIAAIDQPEFSTAGPTGNFLRNILMAAAEFERDMIKQRTSEGMRAKIAKGEWHGGPVPLGYDNNKELKRLVVNVTEAELVKRIFTDYNSGKSSKEITNKLNTEGFKTKKGNLFSAQAVLRILWNPVYLGKFTIVVEGSKGFVNGLHDPIIAEDIFETAQQIRSAHQINHYIHKTLPSEAVFSSLLRCGHCDTGMTPHFTVKNGKKYKYYRCINSMKRDAGGCPVKQINSSDIELIGISLLRMLSKNKMLLKDILENASHSNEDTVKLYRKRLRELIARRTDEQKKVDRLVKIMADDEKARLEVIVNNVNEREEQIKQLDNEILATEKAVEALRQPIEGLQNLFEKYRYFWEKWKNLKYNGRKKAIQTIVDAMTLYDVDKKHFKLEFKLLSSVKSKTSTKDDGGNDSIVCNMLPYGDP